MSDQVIVKRRPMRRTIGIGLVSAAIFTVVTACSAGVPPAPVVAPAPTTIPIAAPVVAPIVVPAAAPVIVPPSTAIPPISTAQPERARPLETFRYTGQPVSAPSRLDNTDWRLEFYRYAGVPTPLPTGRGTWDAGCGAPRGSDPGCNASPAQRVASPTGSAQPLEMFRHSPATLSPTPGHAAPRPLETFRYAGQP